MCQSIVVCNYQVVKVPHIEAFLTPSKALDKYADD